MTTSMAPQSFKSYAAQHGVVLGPKTAYVILDNDECWSLEDKVWHLLDAPPEAEGG